MDETELNALAKEHGEIAVFRTPAGVAVFRTPPQDAYERFVDKLTADKGSKAAAMRELALASRLRPTDAQALLDIFASKPALPLQIGSKLQDMAGAEVEAETYKSG